MATPKDTPKKVKELNKLIQEFRDNVPDTVDKATVPLGPKPNKAFDIIETSHTISYTQEDWSQSGKLVNHPSRNQQWQ